MDSPQAVDKAALYGKFQDVEDKKAALAMKAAHKALDIADDEMHIQANQTHNHQGVGGKTVALVAAAAGLPAMLVAGSLLLSKTPDLPKEPPKAEVKTPALPLPQEKVVTKEVTKDQEYDAIYEVKQPDGTWKQVKRERLKPGTP